MLGELLGLGGSLIGGLLQSRAANKAAEIQRQAAQAASDKVGVALGEANAPIAAATSNAQNGVTTAANYAVDTAGAGAGKALNTAAQSNTLLDPYTTVGGTAADYLNKGVAEGGDFNKKFSMSDLQMDPGFAFRQEQANKALLSHFGGSLGGGAVREAIGLNQDLASQEFGKAYDRYQGDTAARYARLFGTAGMGLDASGQQANNLNTAARYAGDINMQGAGLNLQGQTTVGEFGQRGAGVISGNIMDTARTQADIAMGGANAQGAAKIAAGNAWGGAVANGANTIGSAMIYKDIFKNPAVQSNPNQTTLRMPWQR